MAPYLVVWGLIRLQHIYNFDCSMLYYLLFWTILGFIFHFYIIFGTNLLTGGPPQNCCFFCLFQCFEETEYQTEFKRNETFGYMIFSLNVIQETWILLQGTKEAVTRVGGHPLSRGPLGRPPTYFLLLYKPTYPENIQEADKPQFPPS